uniref:Uncharacterized protein n=1 Tax=Zea mays TaxID=4577 RepID=C0PJX1_MAIZE|nr:unknown [Zea mays]
MPPDVGVDEGGHHLQHAEPRDVVHHHGDGDCLQRAAAEDVEGFRRRPLHVQDCLCHRWTWRSWSRSIFFVAGGVVADEAGGEQLLPVAAVGDDGRRRSKKSRHAEVDEEALHLAGV